ncbi:hypothetical protein [Actinokineospora iranica]|uniref:hypothetical protein n=1 Tax=Actinokineospora iranica TaxID=1271860 RepID=UPI001E362E5F|nr:hypothetical protein [Actinokineospora iranica]
MLFWLALLPTRGLWRSLSRTLLIDGLALLRSRLGVELADEAIARPLQTGRLALAKVRLMAPRARMANR